MAQPDTRTYSDDVTDALALLDDAQREINNWRAHLNALHANPSYGVARQASRSAAIVGNAIATATCDTDRATSRLTPLPPL
jgi:hypothetical protein